MAAAAAVLCKYPLQVDPAGVPRTSAELRTVSLTAWLWLEAAAEVTSNTQLAAAMADIRLAQQDCAAQVLQAEAARALQEVRRGIW
jgi:hypothetical protein